MATQYEVARLNLELFDMRREPVLREARAWFTMEFNPETFAELVALAGGEHNAWFRMVLGYWDMAASMVTSGAIDAPSFLAAHGEIVLTFSKVEPFLKELRIAAGEPAFCAHVEAVLAQLPDSAAVMARRRAATRQAAKAAATRRQSTDA